MPNLRLVEQPDRSPTRCFVCHGHEGPFIDCLVDEMEVSLGGQIALAPVAAYICVRNEENPGCLPQMARLAGVAGVEYAEHGRVREQLAHALSENHQLKGDLALAVEKANMNVAELYDKIGMLAYGVAGDTEPELEPEKRAFSLRRGR